jgi:hypothetical protein
VGNSDSEGWGKVLIQTSWQTKTEAKSELLRHGVELVILTGGIGQLVAFAVALPEGQTWFGGNAWRRIVV